MKVYDAEPVNPMPAPEQDTTSFLEQLLSPQTLQRMMTCGGLLLVFGLVAWLWSIGIFENPLVGATLLGGATLGVLGLGAWLHRHTKHELAGTGLTLLAELALPLNLWFYDAQGLVTISEGGRLWIPAAICCGIYAFIARVLRKPMFVYTLVGGVVMTGMLFLADQSIGRFWEVIPQATFLVVTGWLCVFAERLFPREEGDFSRAKFGKAFHWSGLVVLLSGFATLAGGQIVGNFISLLSWDAAEAIVTDNGLKMWALGLVGFSMVGAIAQRVFTEQKSLYTGLALALFAWCLAIFSDIYSIRIEIQHIALAAAVLIIFGYARRVFFHEESRVWPVHLGAGILFLYGFAQFFAFSMEGSSRLYADAPWLLLLQLVTTVAAGLVGWAAERNSRSYGETNEASVESLHPTAGIPPGGQASVAEDLLIGATSVLSVFSAGCAGKLLGVTSFELTSVLLYVVPAMFAAVVWATRKTTDISTWQNATSAATVICLVYLGIAFASETLTAFVDHWAWCGILLVGAGLFGVASLGRKRHIERGLAIGSVILAVSQATIAMGASVDYAIVLAPTFFGLVLVAYRYATDNESLEMPSHVVVLIGSLLGILYGISRVISDTADFGLISVLLLQLVAVAIPSFLTKRTQWRHTFRVAAIGSAATLLASMNSMIDTHWLLRLEIGSIAFGIFLLVIGHIGWYREGDEEDDAATLTLWFGSVLATLPLALGVLYFRLGDTSVAWIGFHNVTGIVVALVLLGLGMACRIRSTTLGGTALLTTYIVSLVMLIRLPNQLQNVSVMMMVGGGLFFGTAVLLSIYRDRLVKLPGDISEGRGVFKVLRWR